MRLILGLDSPTAGTVTVGGHRYRDLKRPLPEVGSMLEAAAVHPGRSARSHLRALAAANALPRRRVDEARRVRAAGKGSGRQGRHAATITNKTGELESVPNVIARINDAANYVGLERLGVSTQCGFTSMSVGPNHLSEGDPERHLQLVGEVAHQVVW
jgi:hypothetical protein